MSSPKLTYLYLPSIAIILSLIGVALKLKYNEPIPMTLYAFVPIMLVLLGYGIKHKVWKSKL